MSATHSWCALHFCSQQRTYLYIYIYIYIYITLLTKSRISVIFSSSGLVIVRRKMVARRKDLVCRGALSSVVRWAGCALFWTAAWHFVVRIHIWDIYICVCVCCWCYRSVAVHVPACSINCAEVVITRAMWWCDVGYVLFTVPQFCCMGKSGRQSVARAWCANLLVGCVTS
jgi:hypothetical protein